MQDLAAEDADKVKEAPSPLTCPYLRWWRVILL